MRFHLCWEFNIRIGPGSTVPTIGVFSNFSGKFLLKDARNPQIRK